MLAITLEWLTRAIVIVLGKDTAFILAVCVFMVLIPLVIPAL